jgi:hypothetical protein
MGGIFVARHQNIIWTWIKHRLSVFTVQWNMSILKREWRREEKLGKFISIVTWFKIEFHKSSATGEHLHKTLAVVRRINK